MEYTPPLPATAHAPEEENDMSAETDTQTTTVYRVTGMTCGHCEGAVTGELTALPGVTSVKAVAATGEVTVISTAPSTRTSCAPPWTRPATSSPARPEPHTPRQHPPGRTGRLIPDPYDPALPRSRT